MLTVSRSQLTVPRTALITPTSQIVPDTYPAGLGEPLNLILSSDSDAAVLTNTADNGGFLNYALSLNFGSECSQPQPGTGQQANLGDGAGPSTRASLSVFSLI
jgi:hypothetical protein